MKPYGRRDASDWLAAELARTCWILLDQKELVNLCLGAELPWHPRQDAHSMHTTRVLDPPRAGG